MGFQSKTEYLERADFSWSEDSIRHINTPSVSTRRLFFYVQEAGYFKPFPPYFTERANLHSFLIVYTISGRGQLRILQNTYPLPPGSCFYINCMDHHKYECLRQQQWEFLWLHFNGSTALGYYEEFLHNGFRILQDLDDSYMEMTLRRILSLSVKKDLHSDLIISSLITDLLTRLLIANSTRQLNLGFMPDFIKATLKVIENEFTSDLSMDLLAEKAGVSKFHLAREFKRYIGSTIHEYLILTRLSHSKELLKYSNKSVEQVAEECGFHHTSHFIRIFREHEKCTPLRYRKDWGAS